jgi:hypothetical protein
MHFVVILYLLAHGKLTNFFENMKSLLNFLRSNISLKNIDETIIVGEWLNVYTQ